MYMYVHVVLGHFLGLRTRHSEISHFGEIKLNIKGKKPNEQTCILYFDFPDMHFVYIHVYNIYRTVTREVSTHVGAPH